MLILISVRPLCTATACHYSLLENMQHPKFTTVLSSDYTSIEISRNFCILDLFTSFQCRFQLINIIMHKRTISCNHIMPASHKKSYFVRYTCTFFNGHSSCTIGMFVKYLSLNRVVTLFHHVESSALVSKEPLLGPVLTLSERYKCMVGTDHNYCYLYNVKWLHTEAFLHSSFWTFLTLFESEEQDLLYHWRFISRIYTLERFKFCLMTPYTPWARWLHSPQPY